MTKTKQITKLSAMMLAAVSFTACWDAQQPSALEEKPAETRLFTFHVKGSFSVSYTDFDDANATSSTTTATTRAAVRLEEDNSAGITDLWVLDYQQTAGADTPDDATDDEWTLLQQVHQTPADADFGHPQMALSYGHHDVCLIASKGEGATLSATTGTTSSNSGNQGGGNPHSLSWNRVKDTFVLKYPIDVTASSNGNRAPELRRAVSAIKLVMTDLVPQNAKDISITAQRSLSLSLPSLAASALAANTVTMAFPDSWKGTNNNAATTYTLCPTDEFTTDVSVRIIATDNSVISEFTIEDVALKQNRMTALTGEAFGRGSGFRVSIDDAWDEGLTLTF